MQKLTCVGLFLSLSIVSSLFAAPLDEAKVSACRKYVEKKGTQAHVLALETLIESGCLTKVMGSLSLESGSEEKNSITSQDKSRLLKASWLNEVRLLQDSEVSKAFYDLQYAGFFERARQDNRAREGNDT